MRMLNAFVVFSSVLAVGICSPSSSAPPQGGAAVPAKLPGELDLEWGGSFSIKPGWYQDNFGLVLEEEDKFKHKLVMTNRWESDEVLLVSIRSNMESGVEPQLHFQFAGGVLKRCWVDGKWWSDDQFKGVASKGKLRNVTGVAHVSVESGRLACLFTIRGALFGQDKEDPRPNRVMGGFDIPIPAHGH